MRGCWSGYGKKSEIIEKHVSSYVVNEQKTPWKLSQQKPISKRLKYRIHMVKNSHGIDIHMVKNSHGIEIHMVNNSHGIEIQMV